MNVAERSFNTADPPCETARRTNRRPEFTPLFLGDWIDALFIHYETDAEVLQKEVPFELDLWHSRAFVSLVAFSMRRLRPAFGGPVGRVMFMPFANSNYLNVRTYVRHNGEAGIFFLAEFLSNPLCVPLGRPTFGLPYRFGHLKYRHNPKNGSIEGTVESTSNTERFAYKAGPTGGTRECAPETLESFLMERYLALTSHAGKCRLFRISHAPWSQSPVEISVADEGLLATTGDWSNEARLFGANFSPGVRDVRMGWPARVHLRERKKRLTAFFEI